MSEGLSTDSSWGPRIFPLSHARDKTDKCLSAGNLFLAVYAKSTLSTQIRSSYLNLTIIRAS